MNVAGLLPHQVEPAHGLDAALSLHGAALDASECGLGKCLGINTMCRMFDGTTRAVQDILPGEVLMGDNGSPRKVLSVSEGRGLMFKVTPKRGGGKPWRCNGEHILVLRGTAGGHGLWRSGEEVEMTVTEWMKLPVSTKRNRWKMRTTDGWERNPAVLEFDPYIYGLWLGDGGRQNGELTSMDPELSEAWASYFRSRGYRIKEHWGSSGRAGQFFPRLNAPGVWSCSPWRRFIRSSCIGEEKIIKSEFLEASRKQRLELLAGLLDTDGHLCERLNTFEIAVKPDRLSDQISFLAQSLGLSVSSSKKIVPPSPGNRGGVYNRMFISGETSEISTRLPRKKATQRSKFKTLRAFGFDIQPDKVDQFYGLVIDGNRRFLLADGTVTHNTYAAAAVIRHRDLPTLVVCPKISVTGWNRALAHMGTSADVKGYELLATGRTPYGRWEHPLLPSGERKVAYRCECCQCEVNLDKPAPCFAQPSGIHCVNVKQIPHDYGRFIWSDAIKLLVFDEAHRCGGGDSLSAEMMIAAKRQHIKSLALSATAAESPLGLKALGYLLGLHAGPSAFFHWAKVRGCTRPVFGGLHFLVNEQRKKEIMARIHADIFPSRGVRVRTSDVPGFPACQITAELYDLENSGRIASLYETMDEALAELNATATTDINPEGPLTKLLRASQQIELLKVPLFVALRDEALANGLSVALFVNYQQTMDELLKRMKISACIRGGQNPNERQNWIDRFQNNDEHTIVANTSAGGISVSLHDLKGRPRLGVCSIHPSAVKTRQVLGRLARAGGLSPALYRFVLVANTPEERLHKRLSSKLNCMDALLDADLTACNLPLTNGVLSELLEE